MYKCYKLSVTAFEKVFALQYNLYLKELYCIFLKNTFRFGKGAQSK